MFGDDDGLRCRRGPLEVETFLLLHVLVGKGMEVGSRGKCRSRPARSFALLYMPAAEVLDHQQVGEAVNDQAGKAIALGMDQRARRR